MGRILFFVLLAFAVYVGWHWLRRQSLRDAARPRGADQSAPQAMVSCALCGLHLPRSDALPAGERFFCCEEHRRHGSN